MFSFEDGLKLEVAYLKYEILKKKDQRV